MTLYFDNRLPDIAGETQQIAFHEKQPRLAIQSYSSATAQGVVTVYNSDGELLDSEVRSFPVATMAWHPNKVILAVGWSTGLVTIWDGGNKDRREIPELSENVQITHLAWSVPNGKRLVSGNKDGQVKAWRANNKAQLQMKPAWEHKLEGQVTCIKCRPQEGATSDLAKLAVAAVSGDDISEFNPFHIMRQNSNRSSQFDLTQTVESLGFFVTSETGQITFVDAKGKLSVRATHASGIAHLIYCQERSILVAACDDISLSAYRSGPDGTLTELGRVKLSGSLISCAWIAPAVLLSATGDSSLKIWDLQRHEHHLIQPAESCQMVHVTTNRNSNTVAAAAGHAGVIFWTFARDHTGQLQFDQKRSSTSQPASYISWFPKSTLTPLLAVADGKTASFLREQQIQEASAGGLHVLQTAPNQLSVISDDCSFHFDCDVPIYSVAVSPPAVSISSGRSLMTFELSENQKLETISTGVSSTSRTHRLCNQNVYSFNEDETKILVHSLAGIEKQILNLGNIGLGMDINGHFLAVPCLPSVIKIYDLSRREAKQIAHRDVATLVPEIGPISSISVNCAANRVAFLADDQTGSVDGCVYIYCPDRQKVHIHDSRPLDSRMTDSTDQIDTPDSGFGHETRDLLPVGVKWDEKDSKLLSVHYRGEVDNVIICYWSTDSGIVQQEEVSFPPDCRSFLSLAAPYFIFSKDDGQIEKVPLRDFVGLENCDDTTRGALLDFSRLMAIGDLDGAFNAIKLIKNERVWLNLARRCVYTKRIDVARVCLANMGNAAGAAAMRKVQSEPEVDAQVAMLALQLGMNDEAERLYKQCKRYDLLNKFYQSTAKWEDALNTAEEHDRLHLRATHYQYAKKCEWENDINGAIQHYEESKTNVFEVPRMLFDAPDILKEYVMKNSDTDLRQWWAQYQEFCGEFEEAEKYYHQCKNYLSLARVYCCLERVEDADRLANETGDPAACYHMARYHEAAGDIKKAIHFFTRASAYNNVIRICREHGFEDQLLNVALLSTPRDMLEAAIYFEEREDTVDKAVMLYHRAGNLPKAIELVFKQRRFGALEQLVDELDSKTDSAVLSRCAEFFMEHGRHTKAAHLLLLSKKYVKALQLIVDYDIDLSAKMVELFKLPKDTPNRDKIMEAAAQHCYDKTLFQEAAQLFQHAGLRQDAMKCLARLGDTRKMVEFAQLARDPSLFVLAANYLRSAQSWQDDPQVLKAIVTFYRKSKKLESLAKFFIECSQHAIDSTGDYERGIALLGEAIKQLSSSKIDTTDLQTSIRQRAMKIKEYLDTREEFGGNPNNAIKTVNDLLRESQTQGQFPIRIVDLAGLCVNFYASTDPNKAMEYARIIQRNSDQPLSDFVDAATVSRLRASLSTTKHEEELNNDEVIEDIK